MLKNKLSRQEVALLCQYLRRTLVESKQALLTASKEATNDTNEDFEHDYSSILKVVTATETINFDMVYNNRKPKGNVLILLSYNEPLIMCIDPILTALIAGNDVYVRPSSASSSVFHTVWDGIVESLPWIAGRLHIVGGNYENALTLIPTMQAVYLFGSQHIAKSVGAECAKYLVEFWPETEGADFAVFDKSSTESPADFAALIVDQAFSHSGQMCQRPQGVFVHREHYAEVEQAITSAVHAIHRESSFPLPSIRQKQMRDNYNALVADDPSAYYTPGEYANVPSLITNIDPESPLALQAYFLPTLWLIPYDSTDEIVGIIAKRPIQFGCNLWTKDESLIEAIVSQTKLTRLTVNSRHTDIREGEGWGGSQPTSFGGNMPWSQKFSNGYTLIRDEN